MKNYHFSDTAGFLHLPWKLFDLADLTTIQIRPTSQLTRIIRRGTRLRGASLDRVLRPYGLNSTEEKNQLFFACHENMSNQMQISTWIVMVVLLLHLMAVFSKHLTIVFGEENSRLKIHKSNVEPKRKRKKKKKNQKSNSKKK